VPVQFGQSKAKVLLPTDRRMFHGDIAMAQVRQFAYWYASTIQCCQAGLSIGQMVIAVVLTVITVVAIRV